MAHKTKRRGNFRLARDQKFNIAHYGNYTLAFVSALTKQMIPQSSGETRPEEGTFNSKGQQNGSVKGFKSFLGHIPLPKHNPVACTIKLGNILICSPICNRKGAVGLRLLFGLGNRYTGESASYTQMSSSSIDVQQIEPLLSRIGSFFGQSQHN